MVALRQTTRRGLCHPASEHGLASWDLYNICGGEAAVRNWIAAGLMRPDRVHYEPQGYAIQGKLLAEALLRCFENAGTQ